MITSRLTSKGQTTIPQPVRTALDVREGDQLAYIIDGNRVIVSKARDQRVLEHSFRTFTEWDSEIDRKAYGDL